MDQLEKVSSSYFCLLVNIGLFSGSWKMLSPVASTLVPRLGSKVPGD